MGSPWTQLLKDNKKIVVEKKGSQTFFGFRLISVYFVCLQCYCSCLSKREAVDDVDPEIRFPVVVAD